MQIGAHHFASLPSPANESARWPERLPLFWGVLSWVLLSVFGWLALAYLVPAAIDLMNLVFNFISQSIS